MTKQHSLPLEQKATLKWLRFEFWTYINTDIYCDMCILILIRLCVQNLYYSCPIIGHEICNYRFMQVRRSSLVGIKRQRQGGVVEQAKYNDIS